MTNIRKNLIILVFVLSGVLATLVFLNFQKLGNDNRAQILNTDGETLKNYPVKISRGLVNFFRLRSGSSKIVFYEELDSIVYESGFDGKNKKELARIPNVLSLVFSPNGREMIAALSEKGNLKTAYFDLENNQKVELNKNIRSVVFSPDGKKLAYFLYDDKNGEGSISISQPDGSDFKNIFKTRIKNLSLLWPKSELIVLRLDSENGSLMFSITPDGKDFQKIEEPTVYLDPGVEESNILQEMGIEAAEIELSPLKDYLMFTNARDGKLYSLRL